MTNNDLRELLRELEEFRTSSCAGPGAATSRSIRDLVHAELNPSGAAVFAKLSMIHALLGTFSLFFCPQFGLRFVSHSALEHLFSRFGALGCAAGCGAFFAVFSLSAAAFLLRPEELRVCRQQWPAQLSGLFAISLLVFALAGGELVAAFTAVWILGSLGSGLACLEAVWRIRRSNAFA